MNRGTDEAWMRFLEKAGKRRCPMINYSGGTEISGGILDTYPTSPIESCSFHGPIPGIAAIIVDGNGGQIEHLIRDITLHAPFLGMTKSFWHADACYADAY